MSMASDEFEKHGETSSHPGDGEKVDEYEYYWTSERNKYSRDYYNLRTAEEYSRAAEELREERIRQQRFNEQPKPDGISGYRHGWEENNNDLESDLKDEAEALRS